MFDGRGELYMLEMPGWRMKASRSWRGGGHIAVAPGVLRVVLNVTWR